MLTSQFFLLLFLLSVWPHISLQPLFVDTNQQSRSSKQCLYFLHTRIRFVSNDIEPFILLSTSSSSHSRYTSYFCYSWLKPKFSSNFISHISLPSIFLTNFIFVFIHIHVDLIRIIMDLTWILVDQFPVVYRFVNLISTLFYFHIIEGSNQRLSHYPIDQSPLIKTLVLVPH